MFKNYLKLGFRNLLKNRISSFINITGLGMAIGCCMVVFVFLDLIFHQDQFHSKLDRIFVIERFRENQSGKQELLGESPLPLGKWLQDHFPQIRNSVRMNYTSVLINNGDHVIKDQISFVDDGFYYLFDFPLKWGEKNSLINQNGIVLSEAASEKLYGKENPVGMTMDLIFMKDGTDLKERFAITGVFKDKKLNSSFHFTGLIPFSKMIALGLAHQDDWTFQSDITFLEAASNTSKMPTDIQCQEGLALYNVANKESNIKAFNFQPLQGIQFHSEKVNNSRFDMAQIIGIVMLVSIAFGILLLAFFNYMNIAIASTSGRLKEISVRKVMGSERKQIIIQFLLENLIICFIGMLLGLILAKTLFLPQFSKLSALDLSDGLFTNGRVWLALILLMVLSVIGGAAYPSIYISALQPVAIVRGKFAVANKNGFRKILLGVQFCITFLGISMAIAFGRDFELSKSKPWGYDPTENVVVKLDGLNQYNLLKTEVMNTPRVKGITGSVQPLGRFNKQIVIRMNGQEQTVKSIQAIGGFATHFGIKILNGRDLNKDFETDLKTAVLVNQSFLKANHWNTAVGKSIEYGGNHYTIVGETNDFRFETFEHSLEPIIVMACTPNEVNYAYVKTSSGLGSAAHSSIETVWKKLFPDKPFDYEYQDNAFAEYFVGATQIVQVFSAASFIMVLVSACGIFGLALLILSRKMKELSIRKVLGAGYKSISVQILKEFIFSILIAFVIGVPISWLFIQATFSQFTPESSISIIPFIKALLAILLMTLMSVLYHLYKANSFNPIKTLRSE